MTAINISRNAQAQLQVAQWIRNGKAPTAELQNKLSDLLGYAAYVRTRMLFRSNGGLVSAGGGLVPDSVTGTRIRWRHAWHSSPYNSFVYVKFEIAPQNNGTATSPYCLFEVLNTSGTVVAASRLASGSTASVPANVPASFSEGTTGIYDPATEDYDPVYLTADTEYTGRFSDVDFARLRSASVWEYSIEPNTDDGYPSNTTGAGAPIFDKDRSDIITMARLLHRRGGAHLFNWCSETDATAPTQALAGLTGTLSKTFGAMTVAGTGTVGTTVPAFQAVTSVGSADDVNLSVAWPTHESGDVALLIAQINDATRDIRLYTASGFTLITTVIGDGYGAGVWWCRATSTSMAAPVVETNGMTDLAETIKAVMITFRGCVASGTPYEAAGAGTTTAGAVSFVHNASTVPNVLAVALAATDGGFSEAAISGWTNAALTSVTQRLSSQPFGIMTGINATADSCGTSAASSPASPVDVRYFHLALVP